MELLSDYDGTVILVSHSRDEIYRFSEELLVIDDGKQICYGDTKEIFDHPKKVEAARLTGCKNIVPAERLDAHHVRIPDWGTCLHLKQMWISPISGSAPTSSFRYGEKEKTTVFRLR